MRTGPKDGRNCQVKFGSGHENEGTVRLWWGAVSMMTEVSSRAGWWSRG